MTMKRWSGSAMVDLTLAKRWTGSAWVDLTIAKRWTGSAWVDIPLPGSGGGGPPPPGTPVVVTISPGSATKSFSDGEPTCPIWTTNTVTANAVGGTGPYTYSWARISGHSSVLATSDNTAATAFEATLCVGSRSAVYRVTATDSLGAKDTADVNVSI